MDVVTFVIVWDAQLVAEAAERRRVDSYDGYVWPSPKPRPVVRRLPAAEVLAELEWLLDGGLTRWEAAEALGRTPNALLKACERAGRWDLARLMRDGMERVAA